MSSDYETAKTGDIARTYLVTVYVCAKCGEPLKLSHTAPNSPEPATDIVGAHKVNSRIPIHPCEYCYNQAQQPLRLLKAALEQAVR
jgi:hypothetical protein